MNCLLGVLVDDVIGLQECATEENASAIVNDLERWWWDGVCAEIKTNCDREREDGDEAMEGVWNLR